MKNLYIAIGLLISGSAFGQIEQNVNKTTGTESNPITEIDSIRFNAGQTEMEIIFNNGSMESHTIADIDNVTFSGEIVGAITSLDCAGVSVIGDLIEGTPVNAVIAQINYTGGNGGPHNGQTVNSTGVTGLTATLAAGNFANGAGTLTYEISGTPDADGTASFEIEVGGESCILEIPVSTGSISSLDCTGATINGTLTDGVVASGVTVEIGYTGGNGGPHNGQTVTSTGVTGLTATLAAGNFANGAGTVTYEISGTPDADGTASFAIEIGGETCTLEITVDENPYPPGTVHCGGNPTAIVEVINPTTGEVWMDRNLGASQAATSGTDQAAYGDLYQWGRGADGHQCRTSPTTSTLSSTDQPGHGDFILAPNSPADWRSPQNDNLWQGVNGVNNPCPTGFRLPTQAELNAEQSSWSSNNWAGAFASPLKLPRTGFRLPSDGLLSQVGNVGYYWSSAVDSTLSRTLVFNNNNALSVSSPRAHGHSVRCIKD
jgi:uncharacterized protein (TIGR02145 family)